VSLEEHGPTLLEKEVPGLILEENAIQLMTGLCLGNARQFTLICRALQLSSMKSHAEIQLLVNAPPVMHLLRLQKAIIDRDLNGVTECVLALWSKGYNFEDCIAMLEMIVRVYNDKLTADLQYVLQVCAEGHIFQILNRMTTLDLIAVLSGQASSSCLAEP
jgi:hypothetical protein